MRYTIDIRWDDDAGVWYAVCDDIPLALENESLDLLIERVRATASEILSLNGNGSGLTELHIKADRIESIAYWPRSNAEYSANINKRKACRDRVADRLCVMPIAGLFKRGISDTAFVISLCHLPPVTSGSSA